MKQKYPFAGRTVLLFLFFTGYLLLPTAWAETKDAAGEATVEMGEIVVTGEREKMGIEVSPQKTTIDIDSFQGAGIPQNAADFIKDLPITDFRGQSGLVPDNDTIYLRGFGGARFVSAMDGVTIRQTGGRRGSNIVDYALLPPFLIERVEVSPGPHSARYPGKSIGGAVDFITRAPKRYDTLKPDFTVSASYGDYGTQNHSFSARGGAGDVTYDIGYQKYATDGYLRNHEADIDTVFGRIGYILPNDGYLTFQASYTEADRQRPVVNDPDDPASDYDPDFPVTTGGLYSSQKPSWDKEATYYRLRAEMPSPLGNWSLGAYYGEEYRDHFDVDSGPWETHWKQRGGKLSNEFRLAYGHTTTIGGELEQLYDGTDDPDDKRIEILSGFAEHQWEISPRLTLTGGMRYEDVTVNVSNIRGNTTWITGRDQWIERNWSAWSPKSFLTYQLDDHAHWLRDTTVSAGVSRIWRAPDYHGDYNPQGRPAGAWLEPEKGVGYDAIVARRLTGDIGIQLNYSYYRIKDFIATNRNFAEFGTSGGDIGDVSAGMEIKDYKINLEEVVRQGVELQLDGSITNELGFMLGYAYQHFDNRGDEPAGEENLDNRPGHRVTGKLTYQLYDATRLILDYEYQHRQVSVTAEEVGRDEFDEPIYEFREEDIGSFSVFDLGIEQVLFDHWRGMKQGVLKVYVKNLLDKQYINSSGNPAVDRTMGAGISFRF